MKNEVSIKYIGGIEDKEKGLSLTGSSTLMTVDLGGQKVKILTDIGMFQGGNNDAEYNRKIDDEIIKADYVIITHFHADHLGRLPLLVKSGFKGKILMSPITKDIAPLMFEDYVKLTKYKIEKQEEMKKRRGEQLRDYLKAVKLNEDLKNNHLTKEEKDFKRKTLNKLKGNNHLNNYLEEAKIVLAKNDILKESDIGEIIGGTEIELLYDETDIAKTMSMIDTLENYEELNLDNRIIINSIDDEIIEEIPNMILSGYKKEIYVLPHLKNFIINKWKNILDKISEYNKENKDLRKKLSDSLNFIKNPENKNSDEYKKNKNFLEEYGVKSKNDIYKIQEDSKIFPFSKEEINKFSEQLIPIFTKKNEKIIESLKLKFFEAGHVEGSIQAVITIITKKIDNVIGFNSEIKTEHKNFLFSGDLGKFTQPNISGVPDVPNYKFNYVQLEGTYADRNHPDKDEDFKNFIKELNETNGKNLIGAFSGQRTQEIGVELLENKLKNKDLYPEFKALKKALKPLNKRFHELEKIENDKITENEQNEKIRLVTIINNINEEINKIQETLFTGNIIMDSPLSEKITGVFLKHKYEKYKLLDPKIQEEIFGKRIITNLEKGECKNLYTPERIRKKETVISSSGMFEGGAVTSHLKNIIEDKNSKIIASGYQAKGTVGGEIFSEGKKQVIIEENIYDVKSKIYQTKGYSSHIGQSDLIDYSTNKLKYSRSAKLALVHSGDSRKILAEEINKIKKGLKIIIPGIGDEVKIRI